MGVQCILLERQCVSSWWCTCYVRAHSPVGLAKSKRELVLRQVAVPEIKLCNIVDEREPICLHVVVLGRKDGERREAKGEMLSYTCTARERGIACETDEHSTRASERGWGGGRGVSKTETEKKRNSARGRGRCVWWGATCESTGQRDVATEAPRAHVDRDRGTNRVVFDVSHHLHVRPWT